MKLNVMFTIAAVFLILAGLLSLLGPVLAPGAMAGFGILDATARLNSMLAGVGFPALGVIAWLVRNTEPSKTSDSLLVGYIFCLPYGLW